MSAVEIPNNMRKVIPSDMPDKWKKIAIKAYIEGSITGVRSYKGAIRDILGITEAIDDSHIE